MKLVIIFTFMLVASCCNSKKTTGNTATEKGATEKKGALCIQEMIAKFSETEKHLRPSKVYSYQYKGETVYYVVAPCCDNFNELYDAECKLLGNPDGGFTGRGDGKFPDWEAEKKDEKLIWEDKSK
ncbi:MAG: hypothetical protein WAT19_17195 [Ferruginibacter sp.]